MALFNLARMTVSSTGTGAITLNAAVSGFLTFDLAGCSTASTGQAVTYAISDNTASEIGGGTYYSSALALTRGPVQTTNANAAIAMTNAAQVFITPQAKGIIGKTNVQVFTANGTYTPTTGLISAIIECIGGGGGGGGVDGTAANATCAAGGGSGGRSIKFSLAASIGTSQAVTVGAAGAGAAAGNNNGSAGNDTSVGALCIGKGGSGGGGTDSNSGPVGGAGGVAGTGDITGVGATGMSGVQIATAQVNSMTSFPGASSPYGGGGLGVFANNGATNGANASGYGAGGSGASTHNTNNNGAGGNGSAGIVIITEFCSL